MADKGSPDPAPVFLPIEVTDLAAEFEFKLSPGELEAVDITSAGALRRYLPFRRAVTNKVVGHGDELEVYPLHLISLSIEDSGEVLADDDELVASALSGTNGD